MAEVAICAYLTGRKFIALRLGARDEFLADLPVMSADVAHRRDDYMSRPGKFQLRELPVRAGADRHLVAHASSRHCWIIESGHTCLSVYWTAYTFGGWAWESMARSHCPIFRMFGLTVSVSFRCRRHSHLVLEQQPSGIAVGFDNSLAWHGLSDDERSLNQR